MKQEITVNGKVFIFSNKAAEIIRPAFPLRTIYEVYVRPSAYKINAWFKWRDWANEINNDGFNDVYIWIASHNSQAFTISGKLHYLGKVYNIKITKDNNYIYETDEPESVAY